VEKKGTDSVDTESTIKRPPYYTKAFLDNVKKMAANNQHHLMTKFEFECSEQIKPMSSEDEFTIDAQPEATVDRSSGQAVDVQETATSGEQISSEPRETGSESNTVVSDQQFQHVQRREKTPESALAAKEERDRWEQETQKERETVQTLKKQLDEINRSTYRRQTDALKTEKQALVNEAATIRRQIEEATKANAVDGGQEVNDAAQQ
jgi:hypothetical protein